MNFSVHRPKGRIGALIHDYAHRLFSSNVPHYPCDILAISLKRQVSDAKDRRAECLLYVEAAGSVRTETGSPTTKQSERPAKGQLRTLVKFSFAPRAERGAAPCFFRTSAWCDHRCWELAAQRRPIRDPATAPSALKMRMAAHFGAEICSETAIELGRAAVSSRVSCHLGGLNRMLTAWKRTPAPLRLCDRNCPPGVPRTSSSAWR